MTIIIAMGALSLPAATAEDCVNVETSVSGNSLDGQLWQGQKIIVQGLGCGDPARYDFLVFTTSDAAPSEPFIIKQLWGLPGDTLIVHDNGRFEINGVPAKTPFGKPYVLLGSAKTRLGKITGPLDGYLVLGHPGSVDSAQVGLILRQNIIGFVAKAKTG